MDDLESAANVYWGKFIDISTTEIPCISNPEVLLEKNEQFHNLSKEAKYLYDTILSLPDEMFFKQSGVKIHKIKQLLREEGWKWITIRLTLQELKEFAQNL